MKSRVRILLAIVVLAMSAFGTYAGNYTPMDAFISRMKKTTTFVPVTNIWQADNNFDRTELDKCVEESQPLLIDYSHIAQLMQQKNSAISLTFPGVNGGYYTLELGRYDFLANNFEVHAMGENGADTKVNYTPGLYYRGVVKGIPGSVAAFSFFNNEVYGVFSIPDEGNYVLVPNSMVGKEYDYNPNYILYNDVKIKIKDQAPGCATDLLPEQYGDDNTAAKTTTFLNNKVYNSCTEVRVYEVADYDTYTKKGSSVTNVTNFMTALFNNQSTVYRNEGVPIVLGYVQVNTASDVYMSITSAMSIRFLKKFGWATKNVMHDCDLALLLSTRFGSLGGVAWLRALCTTYKPDSSGPYGYANISNSSVTNFPTYSWNLMVLCHEMGHIVGSPHTHKCCWNPPGTGTTVIDACYTIEGSCSAPSPAYPVGGGTVMSYCHLQSVGINLTKGFGTQPGDTIRRHIRGKFSSTCGETYRPNVALAKAGTKLLANRECTDISGGDTTTYYWWDKNTADHADDTLVLMIKKHRQNIGTLDSANFSIETATGSGYGSGTSDSISFPGGTTGSSLANNYAMRRYWKISSSVSTTPAAITVMFPFTGKDTLDVNGSAPGASPVSGYRMYVVANPTNPSPMVDSVQFAPASEVNIYWNAGVPSTTKWGLSTFNANMVASVKTNNIAVGGTLFYPSSFVGVDELNGNGGTLRIFPNPTSEEWYVSTEKIAGTTPVSFSLYSADGRLVYMRELNPGTITTVPASALPVGMYFFRAVAGSEVMTGNITRQ